MISAIVLAPDRVGGEDNIRPAEIVVRSLSWLVSAVVAGVVRDVTLAAPAALGLGDIADQAGCELVQGETEAGRLALAVGAARTANLLIVRTGFEPQTGMIAEIDDLIRHAPAPRALILETPVTLFERVFPDRAAIVGVLAPAALLRTEAQTGRSSFRAFARLNRRAKKLRHRAAAIGDY